MTITIPTTIYQNNINPLIEARMVLLSSEGKVDHQIFNLDYMVKHYDATDADNLAQNIKGFIQSVDKNFNETEYNKQAIQRANYDLKCKHFYNQSKGFPINEPVFSSIIEAGHHIALEAVLQANQLIPDLFRFNDDKFVINKPVLAKHLNTTVKTLDASKALSEMKGSAFNDCYVANETIKSLTSKTSKERLLLIKDGFMKGGYRTFAAKTGRNSGKPLEGFILNSPVWMRFCIQPKQGKVFLKLDWKAQEQWVAAVLSGDKVLLDAYNSADIYMTMAEKVGLITEVSTPTERKKARGVMKTIQLGICYGKGEETIKNELGAGYAHVLDLHKQLFSTFWKWTEENIKQCVKDSFYKTRDGYYYFKNIVDNAIGKKFAHLLKNAPIQAEAAGMLRTLVLLLRPDLDLIATHHDAIYVSCNIEDAEQVMIELKDTMNKAAMEYFGVDYFPKIDPEIIGAGYEHQNYYDDRGIDFYTKALEIASRNNGDWKEAAISAGVKHIDDLRIGKVERPKNIIPSTKQLFECNQQYFPTDIKVISKGIVGIVGNQGTGKTHLLNNIIAQLKETYSDAKAGFIIVEHLTALTGNLEQRTGFTAYKDAKDNNVKPTKDYICSVNSLPNRMGIDTFNRKVLIIDEVAQVLRFLAAEKNDTLKGIRRNVINALKKLIREAEVIILLDADLSLDNIKRIQQWRNNYNEDKAFNPITKTYQYSNLAHRIDNHQLIVNHYKIGEGKVINILPSDAAAFNMLIDNAVNMNSTFVNGTLKKDIKQFHRAVMDIANDVNYPLLPSQVLGIHGDNSSEVKQRAFITNPAELSIKLPIVLSSPSVSTGVSIDAHPTAGHQYDNVIGVYKDDYSIAEDRVQAMMRVRNPEAKKFVSFNITPLELSSKRKSEIYNNIVAGVDFLTLTDNETKALQQKVDNEIRKETLKLIERAYPAEWQPQDRGWKTFKDHKTDEIKKAIIAAELQTRRSIGIYSEELSAEDMDEINFLTEMRVQKEIDILDTGNKTIAIWKDQGYTINYIDGDDDKDKEGIKLLKSYKVIASREHAVSVFNSPVINLGDFNNLKHKPQKSLEEMYSLEKFRILERFNLVDINLYIDADVVADVLPVELIMDINKGRMLDKSFLLELMLKDVGTISEKDLKERTNNYGLTVLDYKHRIEMRKILDNASSCFGYQSFPELFNGVVNLNKKELKIKSNNWESFIDYAVSNIEAINSYFDGRLGKSENVSQAKWFNLIFSGVGLCVRYNKKDKYYNFDLKKYALVLNRECKSLPFCDIHLKNRQQNGQLLKSVINNSETKPKSEILKQPINIITPTGDPTMNAIKQPTTFKNAKELAKERFDNYKNQKLLIEAERLAREPKLVWTTPEYKIIPNISEPPILTVVSKG